MSIALPWSDCNEVEAYLGAGVVREQVNEYEAHATTLPASMSGRVERSTGRWHRP